MSTSPPRSVTPPAADEVLLARYHERGDRAARERLIERHVPLVRRLAWRYRTWGEPYDDLVQSGCIGLVKAVDRFDPSRGDTLLAYAIPTILGEIRRHLRDRGGGVHAPRPVKELAVSVRRTIDDLTASLGRSPTISEVADVLGTGEEEVLEALSVLEAQQTVALDAGAGADGASVDTVGERDPGFQLVDDRSAAAAGLRVLDERERRVVAWSFFAGLTQAQIAIRLGVSQMQVSRVLRGALEKAGAAADGGTLAA